MNTLDPYIPEDFDAFWQESKAEADAVPLEMRRSMVNDFALDGFNVETFRFTGMQGRQLQGWIAYPPGARRLPGFLWIPPYGRESLLPNQYGTREGFVSLSFNFHGYGAFYQEEYTPARGYFAEGASSPKTWIFRTMLQDLMIAARILQAQVEVDEEKIAAMGLSQGGGMAIWLGSLSPIIRCVVADLPFLGAMPYTLSKSAHRYPPKELVDYMQTIPVGKETVEHTLSYYDTLNMALRCAKPTLVSLGEKDPACRPEVVRAIFEALPNQKVLVEYPGGHDWDPSMVDTNRNFMLDVLGS